MFGEMMSLKGLRNSPGVTNNILWDVEPKELMRPRCKLPGEGKEERKSIKGFLFYIDKMSGEKPTLYLMCHTASGYAETVARLEEVPDELIAEAINENKDKEFFGMYPINRKLEDWLRKELGIER